VFSGTVFGNAGSVVKVTLTCNYSLVACQASATAPDQVDATVFSDGLMASNTGSGPIVSGSGTSSITSLITIGPGGSTPVTLHAFPTVLSVITEMNDHRPPMAFVGIWVYNMKASAHY
jgi:hypothetical protein